MHPDACLGFSGGVPGGLHSVTRRGEPFVVFPLGAMVVVKHATRKNGVCFLRGHDRPVSCVAVSHDGARLASRDAADRARLLAEKDAKAAALIALEVDFERSVGVGAHRSAPRVAPRQEPGG